MSSEIDAPFNIVIRLTVDPPNENNGHTQTVYLQPITDEIIKEQDKNNIDRTKSINSDSQLEDLFSSSSTKKIDGKKLELFNKAYEIKYSRRQSLGKTFGMNVKSQNEIRSEAIKALESKIKDINETDARNTVKFNKEYLNVLVELLNYIKTGSKNNEAFKFDGKETTFNYNQDIERRSSSLSLIGKNLNKIKFFNQKWIKNENDGSSYYFPGWESNANKIYLRNWDTGVKDPYFATPTEFLDAILRIQTTGGSRRKRPLNYKSTRKHNK